MKCNFLKKSIIFKIAKLLAAIIFTNTIVAQTIPVVQAYNVLGTRDKAPYNLKYDIVNDKPNWQAYNTDEETKTKLYIAPNGKYLQITDEDTSGGKVTVQFRIVQTQNNKTVVVLNTTVIANGTNKQNSIKFYEVDEFAGFDMKNVLPKMTALQFITAQDLKGQEELFTNGELLYNLNESNTNIIVEAYFEHLEKDCLEGSKNACTAKNKIMPTTTLVWNKTTKRFIKNIIRK